LPGEATPGNDCRARKRSPAAPGGVIASLELSVALEADPVEYVSSVTTASSSCTLVGRRVNWTVVVSLGRRRTDCSAV